MYGNSNITDYSERPELVSLLVNAGADINAENSDDDTMLHLACRVGNLEMIRFLIENGADPNYYTNSAPINEMSWELSYMLNKGERDLGHRTIAIMMMLLEAGANADLRDSFSQTPLYNALLSGDTGIARVLIERRKSNILKAHPSSEFGMFGETEMISLDEGDTPLQRAAARGNILMIKLLLEIGANVDTDPSWRFQIDSPLMLSANVEVARLLLDKGADVNYTNVDTGDSVLLVFCRRTGDEDDVGIVKLLIKRGANIDAKNSEGNSALVVAMLNKKIRIARLLHKAGAVAIAGTPAGATILTSALAKSVSD